MRPPLPRWARWRAGAVLLTLALGFAGTVQAEDPPPFGLVGGRLVLVQDTVVTGNPHGAIALACETCHTADAWRPLRDPLPFDHDTDTAFPLTGRHTLAACQGCHLGLRFDQPDLGPDAGNPDAAWPETCGSCHLDVHRGQLGPACGDCHTTTDFGLVAGVELHARTGFPLTGAHLGVACEACHDADTDGAFAPMGTACADCHMADYEATASSLDGGGVDHVAAGFPTQCEACHTTLSFGTGTVFDHAAASGGFGLVGAHARAECTACHAVGDLTPLFDVAGQDDCVGCHQADYDATATNALVDHVAAGLPTDCLLCHSVESWAGATADHATLSGGFALIGAHLPLACEACHRGPDFAVPENPAGQDDCASCHSDDHQAAHPTFPITCLDCHTTTSFLGATFDHASASGGFDLLGAHAALACEACHTGPDFDPIWDPAGQDDCFTCHEADHQDEHPSFPTTCLDCHGLTSWEGAAFDHETATGFPLVGAHLALACASCHTLPDFDPIWTPSSADDCFTCHEADHQNEHPDFPTTCLDCHSTTSWEGAAFDHGAATGFELVGAHLPLACDACHTLPDFGLINTPAGQDDCVACHAEDHQDEHPDFPTTCLDCHTTTTWEGGAFNHETATGFPLVGAHLALGCENCHTIPGYGLIWEPSGPNDCFACHEDEHQKEHPDFPTTCLDCHTTDTWEGATFDHQSATGFPLVGAHLALGCESCHILPGYELIWDPEGPNDCFTCHEDDHQREHPAFPTTCLDCHTTTTWEGATFDHQAATGFPLLGAHLALGCENCHILPTYELIWDPSGPNDCYTCHEDEYQEEHAGSGFPITCLDCHSTDTWEGATFDHDPFFPIYSGRHQGEWDSCQTCHTVPGNFQVFTCLVCHEHRRSEMDDEHEDVGGYVYESNACYACHPDGEDLGLRRR